jgi:hypothetical protein
MADGSAGHYNFDSFGENSELPSIEIADDPTDYCTSTKSIEVGVRPGWRQLFGWERFL